MSAVLPLTAPSPLTPAPVAELSDSELVERARRGETQYRQSIEDTKKRVAESKQKLASIVKPTLDKSYW